MNYRLTYDTSNIPANTKKNVLAFEQQCQLMESNSDAAFKLGVQGKIDSIVALEYDSQSGSDEEETLISLSSKESSTKTQQKKERLPLFQFFYFVHVSLTMFLTHFIFQTELQT